MSWFRIFTAVFAALIVFTVAGAAITLLLTSTLSGESDSGPTEVRVQTVPPPR
jgi:hypothetical protein